MSDASDGDMEEESTMDVEITQSSIKRKLDETDLMENLKSLSETQLNEIIGIAKKHQADKNKSDNPQQGSYNVNSDFTTVINSKGRRNKNKSQGTTNQNINIGNEDVLNAAFTTNPPRTIRQDLSKQTTNSNLASASSRTKHRNISTTMSNIINKKYTNLFYITPTNKETTRIQMADLWESIRPRNEDVILKTKKGFLLKTDATKIIIANTLKNLQKHAKIAAFSETSPYNENSRVLRKPAESYSCVIASVELDISDTTIAEHLKNINIDFRYCRRIISRNTNNPTHLIRVITGQSKSYETLLKTGLFYKNRHYAIYPSAPPPPAPMPCSKCLEFTHKTEDCNSPIQCQKCQGNHYTSKCKSETPQKCKSCGSQEHQAWAFQCPNRPTQPIEGIPNLPVKTLNKKSRLIADNTITNSRIHSAVTVHDLIINTYVEKLNRPKNVNRGELLMKLRKKFIDEYNIETSVTFVGNNWVYVLMFDLEKNDQISPTETISEGNSSRVRIQI